MRQDVAVVVGDMCCPSFSIKLSCRRDGHKLVHLSMSIDEAGVEDGVKEELLWTSKGRFHRDHDGDREVSNVLCLSTGTNVKAGLLFAGAFSLMLHLRAARSRQNRRGGIQMQEKMPPQVLISPHDQKQPFWWLAPKPFDWVSSSLYIGNLVIAYFKLGARGPGISQAGAIGLTLIITLAIGILLAIDRIEYRR